jgi:apolipoprotein N-acyltransferase
MVPTWLEILATIYLAIGFGSAFAILYDIWIKQNRQKMWMMNIVWSLNAWFLGIFGYWAYKKIGIQSVKKVDGQQQEKQDMQQQSKQQQKYDQSQQKQQQLYHHQVSSKQTK